MSTARIVRLIAVGALLASAALVVALSLVPYETLKSHLDPFSVDRDADVSRAEFADIVARFRLLAAGFVVLAVGLVVAGETVDRLAAEVAGSWWRAVRRSPRALGLWLEREQPLTLAALALVLLTGVAIRVAFLDVPMRYDEATTYDNYVSRPLYIGLANYSTPNNHLLHTFLAKVSVSIFGTAPWAVRLPALVAGIALIPATFALARIFYGRTAALLAAALVASSSTLVEYSTNARGYTIVALLAVVALIAATRVVETDSIAAWAVLACAGALGLYAVPVMLYPLGGVFLWLLLSRLVHRRPPHRFVGHLGGCVLATTILVLLLYAPVFAASGVRSVTSNEFVEPRSWSAFIDLLPGHVWDTLETWDRDLPLVVAVLLGIGLLASIPVHPRLSRFPVSPVLATVMWTIPVLAFQRVLPFTRVWLFLVPVAIASAAAFYARLLDKRRTGAALGAAAAAVVAVAGAWLVLAADSVRESRETGALLDAPAVASYLARAVEPGNRILATGSDTILEYYLGRDGVDAGPLLYTNELRPRTFVVVNVLGGQTIGGLLRELGAPPGTLSAPRLLRRYPSALVYLVEQRA